MVPGEYSPPRTPTNSGPACATLAISIVAPMVAATATAILFDISSSPLRLNHPKAGVRDHGQTG
jgi:hypothetical protein